MTVQKLFAGAAIKRLRRSAAMTQVALAEALDISPSYLNLIERNQRPLSARLMLLLAERFDFDPRQFIAAEPGGGIDAIRQRLASPLFEDMSIDRSELEEWLIASPNTAEAFARLFDNRKSGDDTGEKNAPDPIQAVRREIERWRNHFADLDSMAEQLADELRLGAGDLYGAITERLRVKHQLMIRILPETVLPDKLRRLDLHARQLQLSEMLDPASRTFQAALLLGQIEAKGEIDALAAGGKFTDRAAEKLFRRHLSGYFAAALMMPYGRFLKACEQSGYRIQLLQRRFGAGFEQVAHRLTTLQRVGSRGLPFFMVRIDRAGMISKRYAGASNAPLVESAHRCPLWDIHRVFEQPSEIRSQLVALEDGSTWFTLSRAVQGIGSGVGGHAPAFAIGLGVSADVASSLYYARGKDLGIEQADAIGLGCTACTRPQCSQRSAPPRSRSLTFDEQERGLTPFDFVND
ncbi:helix-turn-helix domain-containing protein [Sphingorhabdus sp. 109]|jgi:predicted transcriptional regulator/DNA-binding XRE family transcriptional regulator|uniref:helix-turn-helix domain-containing protein n=1 Tax=Sphingorhabdus sp. 109 TaxID=2653173 RepID=UPI0012EF34D5|nr:helix-turn-helix transcriptional regulator [Sphingorhabdus sp. 109]VWX57675.1 XRE family transcriptional regulator [Sphingorhabdus sp. 109]